MNNDNEPRKFHINLPLLPGILTGRPSTTGTSPGAITQLPSPPPIQWTPAIDELPNSELLPNNIRVCACPHCTGTQARLDYLMNPILEKLDKLQSMLHTIRSEMPNPQEIVDHLIESVGNDDNNINENFDEKNTLANDL